MHITKYFYNVETKECQFFVYSGCGGNANNFMTAVECESTCKNDTAITMKVPPVNAGVTSTSKSQPSQLSGYTPTSTASVAGASPYVSPQTIPATTAQQTPTHSAAVGSTTATNPALSPPTGVYSTPTVSGGAPVESPAAVTSPHNVQLMNSTLYTSAQTASSTTPLSPVMTGPTVQVTHKNVTDIPGSKRTLPGTPAKAHHADVSRQFVVDGEDCLNTKFGCCEDGNSPAIGNDKEGCPESKF